MTEFQRELCVTRTERLLTSLFSNWSLPMGIDGETDEQAEISAARRMVRFVRAIEKELDRQGALACGHLADGSNCDVTCAQFKSTLTDSDEVTLAFRGRVPTSYATMDTFSTALGMSIYYSFPNLSYMEIAKAAVDVLFRETKLL